MLRIKKKRCFILLEVLIALSLVCLFAIPLIATPLFHCKKESQSLQLLQLDSVVDKWHAEVLEKLYNQQISFQEMEKQRKNVKPVRLTSNALFYNGKHVPIEAKAYCFLTKNKKVDVDKTSIHLVEIHIEIKAEFFPENNQGEKIKRYVFKTLIQKQQQASVEEDSSVA